MPPKIVINMARTKQQASGPRPDPTPEPPPPSLPAGSDDEYKPIDEESLAKMIPESIIAFKAGPPPKKSPRQAAMAAAAAISEEIEEEKNEVPRKGRGFGKHGKQFDPGMTCNPTAPFIRGQIGKLLITEKPIQQLDCMPDGYSLIVSSWRKALPGRGGVSNQYEITDPYGNVWWAPPVFGMWREAVEGGTLPDLSLEDMRLAIVKDGPFFSLCTSKRRQSFHDVLHPLPSSRTNIPIDDQ